MPNLFVGTEYLRNLYGDCIVDYLKTKDLERITFSNNDNLEIICIAPWQIEKLNVSIDYFHNAHSFVEMPKKVVKRYSSYVEKLLSQNGRIALVSYGNFDADTTFNPDNLATFFKRKFEGFVHDSLLNPSGQNFYYVT